MKIVSNATASIAGITAALSFVAEQAEAAVIIYTPPTPFLIDNDGSGSFDPDSNLIDSNMTTLHSVAFFCGYLAGSAAFVDFGHYELAFHEADPLVDTGLSYDHSDFTAVSSSRLDSSSSLYIQDKHLFWGIGIRDIDSTGDFRLGWLEFSDSSTDSENTRTIYRWGFEDTPGASITIPQAIPEPSSLLLISLGGLGMLSHRRRTC